MAKFNKGDTVYKLYCGSKGWEIRKHYVYATIGHYEISPLDVMMLTENDDGVVGLHSFHFTCDYFKTKKAAENALKRKLEFLAKTEGKWENRASIRENKRNVADILDKLERLILDDAVACDE